MIFSGFKFYILIGMAFVALGSLSIYQIRSNAILSAQNSQLRQEVKNIREFHSKLQEQRDKDNSVANALQEENDALRISNDKFKIELQELEGGESSPVLKETIRRLKGE